MSKMTDEVAELANQIEEQLRFYRDIGITDLGGSAGGAKRASEAGSEAHASSTFLSPLAAEPLIEPESLTGQAVTTTVVPAPLPQQAPLFGDLVLASEATSARSKGASLPVLEARDASLESIREDIGDCRRCKLSEHRKTIVFGEGNPKARLVFIGEGPGAEEDATGRPFVGRAGQLLDKIIAAIGLKREDVYIANIVKCRPPGNRTPEKNEVETCEQFLFRQLEFIKPKVIVALGSPAFQCLMRTREPISRARGEWRDWNGVKLMPTFHPAFLLRSPDKKREVWEDMKKVRVYLDDPMY
jgi:uracil-DNA glycosylase family 4